MYNKLQEKILKDFLKENFTDWIITETENYTIVSEGHFAVKIPNQYIMIDFKKAACRRTDLEHCFKSINPAVLKSGQKTGNIKEMFSCKRKNHVVEFMFGDQFLYINKKFLDLLEIEKIYCEFRAFGKYKPLCVLDPNENIIAIICPIRMD